MRKRPWPLSVVGILSVALLLAALAAIIPSSLAVYRARAAQTTVKKAAILMNRNYAVEAKAEELLLTVQEELDKGAEGHVIATRLYLEGAEAEYDAATGRLCFEVESTNLQTLTVELALADGKLSIDEWNMVNVES